MSRCSSKFQIILGLSFTALLISCGSEEPLNNSTTAPGSASSTEQGAMEPELGSFGID